MLEWWRRWRERQELGQRLGELEAEVAHLKIRLEESSASLAVTKQLQAESQEQLKRLSDFIDGFALDGADGYPDLEGEPPDFGDAPY